ncbi:anti-sigma-D factor RsdA [Rhodococcus sp. IEGM 1381]|uniref:anti-sigma-D factor RsdA n=1 Tax=Rhodococcus sp. IEGM 1381 TaxID=3047085 RepID=UPI0024B83AC7|nr:anti-sigma-D factor RsdA [Rhodococcus sp. IEGM 1381]MDI9897764.1 anti-sigma-D factor RsdA [Rhodococcus sp. IEGM 1381]
MARDIGHGGSGENPRRGISRIGEHVNPTGPKQNDPYADIGADGGPVDLVAVRRDDAFIDAISGDGPIATDDADEYQLALLLANWRADVMSPAMPAGPSLDVVVASVEREKLAADMARRSSANRGGRMRLLRPIAGAAAAIAVVMGGLVVISYNSTPDDPLWSVKSVVFSEQADSTVAQIDTTSKLQEAENLLSSGDADAARALLDGASNRTSAVLDASQRAELDQWLARLLQELQALTVPVPVPPAVPVPSVPAPVPSPDVVSPQAPVDAAVPDTSAVPITPNPETTTPSSPPVTTSPSPTTTDVTPTVLLDPNQPTATAGGSSSENRDRMSVPSGGS